MNTRDLKEAAIILNRRDNCAVAKIALTRGDILTSSGTALPIEDNIRPGIRFALSDIARNSPVIQYGLAFALSKGIQQGQAVTEERVTDMPADYASFARTRAYPGQWTPQHLDTPCPVFMGYRRPSGQAGTRNHYLVIPASLCASDTASKIAASLDTEDILKAIPNIDSITAAAHTEGCGCADGPVIDRLLMTLKNTVLNPNVGGALIVDLGCEKTSKGVIFAYFNDIHFSEKPVDYLTIQKCGGSLRSLEEGRRVILERLEHVNKSTREPIPLSSLVTGTECGASDSFSGITANPLIGHVVDTLITWGGSAILSETPEMLGAETCLIERMVYQETAARFLKGLDYYKGLAGKLDVSMGGNLVPGNKEGGLINLALKSLGAVTKGGTAPIVDFLDYAQRIRKPGLSLMNGPGNDLESMTGIAASGATVFLFSTGMGATEGNALAPCIKISSRTELFEAMPDDIDFDAGILLSGAVTLEELSAKLLERLIAVASGEKTRAEHLKKRSFQLWTAGKLSL